MVARPAVACCLLLFGINQTISSCFFLGFLNFLEPKAFQGRFASHKPLVTVIASVRF